MDELPLCAPMDDGHLLPIIDITHPIFALSLTDAETAAMMEEYARAMSRGVPPQVAEALRQSTFGRALMEASGSFLAGLPTYRMKLGPDNLGPDASPIDRQIAGSPPAVFMRLRMQDVAQLSADALLPNLAADRQRPVLLVNIGGGVAADSWNALLAVEAARPGMLAGRHVEIDVLELDDAGPTFGSRAVEALTRLGAPLQAVHVRFRHFQYDWSQPEKLPELLGRMGALKQAASFPQREQCSNMGPIRRSSPISGRFTKHARLTR